MRRENFQSQTIHGCFHSSGIRIMGRKIQISNDLRMNLRNSFIIKSSRPDFQFRIQYFSLKFYRPHGNLSTKRDVRKILVEFRPSKISRSEIISAEESSRRKFFRCREIARRLFSEKLFRPQNRAYKKEAGTIFRLRPLCFWTVLFFCGKNFMRCRRRRRRATSPSPTAPCRCRGKKRTSPRRAACPAWRSA